MKTGRLALTALAVGLIDCGSEAPQPELADRVEQTVVAGTPPTLGLGNTFGCSLYNGGKVICWGDNSLGQLGNGTNIQSVTPVSVSGITTATAVSVGAAHACAVLSDGAVKCWGANSYGALGNNTQTNSNIPVSVTGITTATMVAAGSNHSCARLTDGMRCTASRSACWLAAASSPADSISTPERNPKTAPRAVRARKTRR